MPRFRVEYTETVTTVKEKWFTAKTEAGARSLAESEDQRDESWEEISSDVDCGISDIDKESN